MVLRMKNFNVFGVHRKIKFYIEEEVCLKSVLGQFADSKGGLGNKEGVVF